MRPTDFSDHKKPQEIIGKTVAWAGTIKTEYGRIGNHYLLLKFTDGTRQVIGLGNFSYYNPDPDATQMCLAPDFFTDQEIWVKEDHDRAVAANRAREDLERKREQLQRLKKELGDEA